MTATATVAETASLVHGYTMADVERIAWVAVHKHTQSRILDTTDRYDAAWDAVVVELYSRRHDADAPRFFELLSAGMSQLDRECAAYRKHHGISTSGGLAPSHQRYWLPVRAGHDDGFSERLCEVIALREVLGVLTDGQYEAIATLAAFDNRHSFAAEAINKNYSAFNQLVLSARKRVKAVWFEGEQPVMAKATAEACKSGHARAEHGHRKDDRWHCRACSRAAERRRRSRAKVRAV